MINRLIILAALSLSLSACNISGSGQKGPFLAGSAVKASKLNQQAQPIASKTINTAVFGQQGRYSIGRIEWNSWTELSVTGNYFDEFANTTSSSSLSLDAITRKDRRFDTANIHLLSHIAAERIRYLVNTEGKNRKTAWKQTQREMKSLFGLKKVSDNFHRGIEQLNLTKGQGRFRKDNANLLLFTGSFLATGGNASTLAALSNDFSDDGQINGGAADIFRTIANKAGTEGLLTTLSDNLKNHGARNPPNAQDMPNLPSWVIEDAGDTTPPVITVTGANPVTVTVGTSYADEGATATDNIDEFVAATAINDSNIIDTSEPGTFTVTYRAIDIAGNETTETRTVIVIKAQNNVPIAIGQDTTVDEDSIDNIIVLSGTDGDEDVITFSIAQQPENGTLSINGETVTYKPNANFFGTDIFTFTVSDSKDTSEAATVTIDVLAINDAPTANAGLDTSVGVNNSVTLTGTGADVDTDDVLSYSWTVDDTEISTTASFEYTPTTGGTHELTFTVSDGTTSSSDTVIVEVDLPPPYQITFVTNETEVPRNLEAGLFEQGLALIASVVDGDGNTIDAEPTFDSSTVDLTTAGEYPLEFSFTDEFNRTITEILTVTVKNHLPIATGQPVTVDEDSLNNEITLTGSDNNFNDPRNYAIVTQPIHGSLTGTAPNVRYTPEANYKGSDSFTFTLNDGTDTSAPAAINIMVTSINDAPTVNAGVDVIISAGDSYTPNPTANDIDGTITTTVWTVAGGTVLTFPKADFSVGVHVLTIAVTDNEGLSATDTLTVTVKDTTPPIITLNGGDITIEAGSTYVELGASVVDNVDENISLVITGSVDTTSPGTYIIIYTATDTARNVATTTRTVTVVDTTAPVITVIGEDVSIVEGSTYVDQGATAVDIVDGVLTPTVTNPVDTSTPNTYTITYTVTDEAGNTATETRTVTVTRIADTTPPAITIPNGNQTIILGEVYIDEMATATDDRDETVTVTSTGTVDTSIIGTYKITYSATDDAGNTATKDRIVLVVFADQYASEVIEFSSQYTSRSWSANQVLETSNTFYYGDRTTAWAPRTRDGGQEFITVRFPKAVYSTGVTIRENSGNGFVYQIDALDSAGNLHTVWTGTDPSQPNEIVDFFIEWQATDYAVFGLKVYIDTSSPGWEEIDSIRIHGEDNVGPEITILGENPVTVLIDSDYVDAGATAIDVVDGTNNVTVGILSNNVNTSIAGAYKVIYEAVDSKGNVSQATRNVTVSLPENTAPRAVSGLANADEDSIDNPITLVGQDDEGDALTFEITAQPLNGTINQVGDTAELTYTPKADFAGTDSFQFKVSDGELTSAATAFAVIVKSINDAPRNVSAGSDVEVAVNESVTLVGVGIDIDGAQSPTYTWSENGIVIATTASFDYIPTTSGPHELTLTVTDDEGASTTDTVIVTAKSSIPSEIAIDFDGPLEITAGTYIDINDLYNRAIKDHIKLLDQNGIEYNNGDYELFYEGYSLGDEGDFDTQTPGNYVIVLNFTDDLGEYSIEAELLVNVIGILENSITGRVTSTDGNALTAVTVNVLQNGVAQNITSTTNTNGDFSIDLAPATEYTLSLTADGYANQVQRVKTSLLSQSVNLDVVMIPRAPAQTVENLPLVTITGNDGASVSLSPQFTDSQGNSVGASDGIKLTITPVDISSPTGVAAFPGDFAGIAEGQNEASPIISYGTVEYQFTRESDGEVLQLADDTTADILIPIYTTKHQDGTDIALNDTIPLWSLNEDTAIWSQEGTGTVVSSDASPTGFALSASVSHFTWWNADAVMNPATAQVTVNAPEAGTALIKIRTTAGNIPGWRSDSVNTVIAVGTTSGLLPIPSNTEVCFWAEIDFTSGANATTQETCVTVVSGTTENITLEIIDSGLSLRAIPTTTSSSYINVAVKPIKIKPTTPESVVTYSIDSGQLPAGVELSSISNTVAVIKGTPTQAGDFNPVVKGVDSEGNITTLALSYTVNDGVQAPALVTGRIDRDGLFTENPNNQSFQVYVFDHSLTTSVHNDLHLANTGGDATHWEVSFLRAELTNKTHHGIDQYFDDKIADLNENEFEVSMDANTGELTITWPNNYLDSDIGRLISLYFTLTATNAGGSSSVQLFVWKQNDASGIINNDAPYLDEDVNNFNFGDGSANQIQVTLEDLNTGATATSWQLLPSGIDGLPVPNDVQIRHDGGPQSDHFELFAESSWSGILRASNENGYYDVNINIMLRGSEGGGCDFGRPYSDIGAELSYQNRSLSTLQNELEVTNDPIRAGQIRDEILTIQTRINDLLWMLENCPDGGGPGDPPPPIDITPQ